uniref:Uncharacterized protein n=1 Tax=Meloidogyne enterolobii TaxID=390850 RepID=A0A6V7V856_MELEN|nr:unnamed protein product [Meloidogyne enterolobii]
MLSNSVGILIILMFLLFKNIFSIPVYIETPNEDLHRFVRTVICCYGCCDKDPWPGK